MTRRTLLRTPLVALALLAAAAPSLAPAGGIYGTKRTCPLQFKNWMGRTIDVEITHNYGVYSDKYTLGSLKPGDVRQAGTVTYYTGGGLSAGDYWTVGFYYTDDEGKRWVAYRALDPFDLRAIDAGVPFTVIAGLGDYDAMMGTRFKVNYYSNGGSKVNLPLCYMRAY